MNNLFMALMAKIKERTGVDFQAHYELTPEVSEKVYIIPPDRNRYLAEIVENNHEYKSWVNEQCVIAQKMFQLKGTIDLLKAPNSTDLAAESIAQLEGLYNHLEDNLAGECKRLLREWPETVKNTKKITLSIKFVIKRLNKHCITNRYRSFVFLKSLCQNMRLGVIYCVGC